MADSLSLALLVLLLESRSPEQRAVLLLRRPGARDRRTLSR
jgi:hypothetical protein